MARMPGADYRPLAVHGGRMTGHDIACLHTMVGSLWGTDAYFQSGVANSHFGTGGDGHLVQWLDTAIESWANLDGNPNVISIENADMGPEFAPWTGSDVPPFTDAQVETLARWLAWVCSPAAHADCPTSWRCHTEGIPLELIPDDRPGRRGVGYHRHGINDWRVPAGVLWSSHPGKVCPGDRRIAQVPAIIAMARSYQEDDMPSAQEIAQETVKELLLAPVDPHTGNVRTTIRDARIIARRTEVQVIALNAAVEALATAKGGDPAEIKQTVTDAVDAALKDLKITLSTDDTAA